VVGAHEGRARRLHSSIDVMFRTTRLAVAGAQYIKAAREYDEVGGENAKHVALRAALDVSKALNALFDRLEEVDELLTEVMMPLEDDERPEIENGGFQVFGGADAEAALERLAALYKLDRHRS
jgi:hypothetical protein